MKIIAQSILRKVDLDQWEESEPHLLIDEGGDPDGQRYVRFSIALKRPEESPEQDS